MASIHTVKSKGKKTPVRVVRWVAPDGRRKTLRLGPVGHDVAMEFKRKIERLLS